MWLYAALREFATPALIWFYVVLGLLGLANVVITLLVAASGYRRSQKWLLGMLVWCLPFFGALFALLFVGGVPLSGHSLLGPNVAATTLDQHNQVSDALHHGP